MSKPLSLLVLTSALLAALSLGTAHAVTFDCRACEAGARFYDQREDGLAWTGPANAPLFAQLVEAVRMADRHGLAPEDYHLSLLEAADPNIADRQTDELATDAYLTLAAHLLAGRLDPVTIEPNWTAMRRGRDLVAYLQASLASGAVTESLDALAPSQSGYHILQEALARYQAIEAEGGWPTVSEGPTFGMGDRGPRVAELRARLAATGDIVAEAAEPELFDEDLSNAVRRFQARASLDVDGRVGALTLAQLNLPVSFRTAQIRANLERRRWLPDDMGRRHIRVNIADFSLEARNEGIVERQHDVIVGRLFRRTPVFSGSMTYFVLNPWWETPPSLAVQDKLPAFRQDPDAVQRLGFQVIDREGGIVDATTINWADVPARGFPYRLRQAPGPLNALGEVKFMFPNPHNVYLHDTPTRGLFAQQRRNFSSGCIRVRDPLELANWVAAETPEWTAERIQSVAGGNSETRVPLSRSLPVHILYWTVVPDADGGVRFLDDLYDRDGGLIAALEAAPPPLE